MKKFILAASAAALLSPAAFAQQAGGVISGHVDPICAVTDAFDDQQFPSMNQGAFQDDGFTVTCNDADGVRLQIISTENGMENDDNEDQVVNYEAELTIAGFNGTAQTDGPGGNDKVLFDEDFTFGDLSGGASGTFGLTLLNTGLWAGGYQDTIQIQITAK